MSITSISSNNAFLTNAITPQNHYTPEEFIKCLNTPYYRFPPNPIVDGNLDAKDFDNVNPLPEGVCVKGNLNFNGYLFGGCHLPNGWNVEGDLDFSFHSFHSLQKGLSVGGHLYLRHCYLTTLPDWITQLGLTSSGDTRKVFMEGIHLPEDAINRLKQTNAPGMQFYFSPSGPNTDFKSLEEALNFWREKTKITNLPLPRIELQPQELTDVLDFLGRLKIVEFDYIRDKRQTSTAIRIMEKLEHMSENDESKRQSIDSLRRGLLGLGGSPLGYYTPEQFIKCLRTPNYQFPPNPTVVGGLSMRGYTDSFSLPAGLHVTEYLDLSYSSLTSLPEGLYVGDDLDLRGCFSLTSLPNCITQLGFRSNGLIRFVYLENTGLSEDVINRLRQHDADGTVFYFSHAASTPNMTFETIEQAINFWKKEANTTLPLLVLKDKLQSHELIDVLNFLARLTTTAEYKNLQSLPILATRVMEAFKLMAENDKIKKRAVDLIYQGLTSCDDRIISALDEIELMVNIYHLENSKLSETELRKLGKSYLLLEMVNQKAEKHKMTLLWVDEIEIYLAFQTVLADRFNLPLSTRNMLFRGCAQITTEQIHKIGDIIEKECTPEALETFLPTWSPWIKFQRRNAIPSYESISSILATQNEYECCIMGGVTIQPVMYGGKVYDYATFITSFKNNPTDPFTREPIDLSKLIRISLPLSSKESKEEIDK